mgnify:CR=1 FL=1
MVVKYFCPKCERRFVDWGAEKLGFKCPSCPNEELLRVGANEPQSLAAPRLTRRPIKPAKHLIDDEMSLTDAGTFDEDLGEEIPIEEISDFDVESEEPEEEEEEIKLGEPKVVVADVIEDEEVAVGDEEEDEEVDIEDEDISENLILDGDVGIDLSGDVLGDDR